MATVTPILRIPKSRPDGHAPLWLRFTDARRSVYHSLGIYLHPRHWNDRKQEVRKGHPHSEQINGLIAKRLAEVEDKRLRLMLDREPVTLEALREAVAPAPLADDRATDCFLAYVERFLEGVGKGGNVRRVRRESVVVGKLREFAEAGGATLPFERITPEFLRDFEAHLLGVKKNKASTVHANVGVIKIHYRRAIREGLVPRESDPFFAYTPGRAQRPERPKLTVEQLRAIERLDLGPNGAGASLDARTRDAFLFSLYAAGIRFGDVAGLRCGDVTQDPDAEGALRLTYRMGKTKKRVAVRLIPQAAAIARAYATDADGAPKPPDAFLFGMLDGYDLSTPKGMLSAVASQNALTNKYLKRVAKLAATEEVPMPAKLSFHIARHSFADLARKAGWDVYAISKALGHSGLNITEHYLAGFDASSLDAKMDALFDAPPPRPSDG